MAQHISIETFEHETVKRIARSIRNQRSFSGSLKYEELRHKDYKQSPEDRVFVTHRTLPNSLVFGGRATIEVHTKPRKGYGQEATNIYVVA